MKRRIKRVGEKPKLFRLAYVFIHTYFVRKKITITKKIKSPLTQKILSALTPKGFKLKILKRFGNYFQRTLQSRLQTHGWISIQISLWLTEEKILTWVYTRSTFVLTLLLLPTSHSNPGKVDKDFTALFTIMTKVTNSSTSTADHETS